MDMRKKLQDRVEAIKADILTLESRLKTHLSDVKEIEAALRVMDKYSENGAPASVSESAPETVKPTINITDAILQVVREAGEAGAASGDIRRGLKDKYGFDVRPDTLSVTIQRHKAKKNIAKRGNQWVLPIFAPATSEAETPETPVGAPESDKAFLN